MAKLITTWLKNNSNFCLENFDAHFQLEWSLWGKFNPTDNTHMAEKGATQNHRWTPISYLGMMYNGTIIACL